MTSRTQPPSLRRGGLCQLRSAVKAAPVGGPIEIAGITKHEGFKWVRRKHYFDTAMNPRE